MNVAIGSAECRMRRAVWGAVCCALGIVAAEARAANAPAPVAGAEQPSWQVPQAAAVRKQLQEVLQPLALDAQTLARVDELWKDAGEPLAGQQLHLRLVASLALADPRAKQVVDLCAGQRPLKVSPPPLLSDEQAPPLVRANLRLHYGRWLAQELLLDEALDVLSSLRPQDVVDPASLLFFQAVLNHQFLNKDAGLEALDRLLENPDAVPRRYLSLAALMQADLSGLKDDSLDHISRRMDDIRRRLDLGHAGPKVRNVQDGVIASLDKLIKQVEEEQQRRQQQMQQQQQGPGSQRSSSPAPDSARLQGKAPGNVTQKNIGSDSGWGSLPPKQREEAMQQIGKDFPAHYRDVIEQYFRKLASESSQR